MLTMKDANIKFTHYKRGDIITGSIVMITKRGAIVNIGGMKDGIVPIDEVDSVYKEGDAILVMVTDKVDEYGCVVLDAKNVNKAIEEFNPFAVDLSSSLETDGFKDENKIREIMEVIH